MFNGRKTQNLATKSRANIAANNLVTLRGYS
jgi:hypothetical protein